MSSNHSRPRRVAIVAFPDVALLDVAGPADVFSLATHLTGIAYDVEIVAATKAPLRSASGIEITPRRALGDLTGPLDTLMVAGGVGAKRAEHEQALVDALGRLAPRSRRVTSVCTGAFLLARAGLLDGRSATTHWKDCDRLARRFPAVRVEPDRIFVRDGNVWTSAGVTAGIDLALALVEDDAGPSGALAVARSLVVFVKRPGGQSQFSTQLQAQLADRDVLRELQAWMADHLAHDLSVDALAERAGMSPRNFARVFRTEVGMPPAAYVQALRTERARVALESTRAPVEVIARQCGFGTPEALRRAMRRRLGVSPAGYRERFSSLREQAGRGRT
jgi:transcriptional regulator GlxA family with amidase domain